VTKKMNTVRVTILNEEYALRSDTPPEHAKAVAYYLDQAIRKIMATGAVVESNRAVVLAALQITAELFDSREKLGENADAIQNLSEFIRPLLPPGKRQISG